MTVLVIAVVVLAFACCGLLYKWGAFSKTQASVPNFDEPYECYGYDVNGEPISDYDQLAYSSDDIATSCHAVLDAQDVHIVSDVYQDGESFDPLTGDIDSPDSGSSVSREFCERHCPGGCNRGCAVYEGAQTG